MWLTSPNFIFSLYNFFQTFILQHLYAGTFSFTQLICFLKEFQIIWNLKSGGHFCYHSGSFTSMTCLLRCMPNEKQFVPPPKIKTADSSSSMCETCSVRGASRDKRSRENSRQARVFISTTPMPRNESLFETKNIYHCQGVVQLGGLVKGSPRLVPLRLRLARLFYALKVLLYWK